MREYTDVVIVGAGAAGLFCARRLAKAGVGVSLLDKNKSIGKKLSATGNGRCNFTNMKMTPSCYYGNEVWIRQLLEQMKPEDVRKEFQNVGIFSREKDGYVYPYTNQAVTVVEAFEKEIKKEKIDLALACKVTGIQRTDDYFRVRTTDGEIRCRVVVLATGGKANAELGGDGSGYKLARSQGHKIHTILPGLTGLKADGNFWQRAAGTRIQGKFSLLIDGKKETGETGEIQIVKEGVSGIPVFQMCRIAAQALSVGKSVEGVIDFVPPMEEAELNNFISLHGISGLVPKKWVPILENRPEAAKQLKNFTFPIYATFGMERAQVTAGGISTDEVEVSTMESKRIPSLYLIGEVLDVDGKCGGYNLHFAWSTGKCAADAIIRKFAAKSDY